MAVLKSAQVDTSKTSGAGAKPVAEKPAAPPSRVSVLETQITQLKAAGRDLLAKGQTQAAGEKLAQVYPLEAELRSFLPKEKAIPLVQGEIAKMQKLIAQTAGAKPEVRAKDEARLRALQTELRRYQPTLTVKDGVSHAAKAPTQAQQAYATSLNAADLSHFSKRANAAAGDLFGGGMVTENRGLLDLKTEKDVRGAVATEVLRQLDSKPMSGSSAILKGVALLNEAIEKTPPGPHRDMLETVRRETKVQFLDQSRRELEIIMHMLGGDPGTTGLTDALKQRVMRGDDSESTARVMDAEVGKLKTGKEKDRLAQLQQQAVEQANQQLKLMLAS